MLHVYYFIDILSCRMGVALIFWGAPSSSKHTDLKKKLNNYLVFAF